MAAQRGYWTNAIIEGATELTCKGIPVAGAMEAKLSVVVISLPRITDFNLG
ncbi:hypothetical protein [Providencia huaxiensis]|uniref:hypothetical protein n=1 Tax=Providencia huaxiensis TaxID=2027290 RepID=UPI0034DD3845